jgi:ammonium transporter Rh
MYLLVMLEMIFYTLNRTIITDVMFAVDSAGSMTIHMFGAYFGLTCAFYYKPKRAIADEFEQGKHNYNSRLIAMIGTLFLFVYWPSFNSALSTGVAQQRAAINTFFAITASALTAGFMGRVVKGGRMDMEIIMNATLAGGVMIAASVEMIFNPGYAIIVGVFAGITSSLAYTKLTPFMETKVKIHDTCGVQFLHGIPGQLGAVTSAIAAGLAIYNYDNQFQLE